MESLLATAGAELVEAGDALIAQPPAHARLALTLTLRIALTIQRADLIALARGAVVLARSAPMVRYALLAVWALKNI